MANILAVYSSYQIMSNLKLHMLRVTGVAKILCDELVKVGVVIDTENVIAACLLHDMGNILKFDLTVFPESLEPQGPAFWHEVQTSFQAKYGSFAHPATIKIVEEIGVNERVKELIDAISFNREKLNWESADFAKKVCAYADMRVAPQGVVSMKDRLADGRKRYSHKKEDTFSYVMAAYVQKIETQIFEKVQLKPEEVTESSVEALFNELQKVEV